MIGVRLGDARPWFCRRGAAGQGLRPGMPAAAYGPAWGGCSCPGLSTASGCCSCRSAWPDGRRQRLAASQPRVAPRRGAAAPAPAPVPSALPLAGGCTAPVGLVGAETGSAGSPPVLPCLSGCICPRRSSVVARRRDDMADTTVPRRFMLALAASMAAVAFCAAAARRSRPPPPKLAVRSSTGLHSPRNEVAGSGCLLPQRTRRGACRAWQSFPGKGTSTPAGTNTQAGTASCSPERHDKRQHLLPLLVSMQGALVEAAAMRPAPQGRHGAG